MIKKQEFHRRSSNQGGAQQQGQEQAQGQRPQREHSGNRVNNRENRENRDFRDNRDNRDNRESRESNQHPNREAGGSRPPQRDSSPRQSYSFQNTANRYSRDRVKAVETVEDIKADITRIEKEIELEIKEIKTMRLGL